MAKLYVCKIAEIEQIQANTFKILGFHQIS